MFCMSDAAAQDLELGAHLGAQCRACHANSGAAVPVIAGKPAADLAKALHAYKRQERANPIMQSIAAGLTDEDIAAVSAYFEGLKP